jgi:hypothetical protein
MSGESSRSASKHPRGGAGREMQIVMMTVESFRESLTGPQPPAGLGPALEALWWAGRGDWKKAHACVQAHEGEAQPDLVHAHLHRQEGDMGNARYWYRNAGRAISGVSLTEEWAALVGELLSAG